MQCHLMQCNAIQYAMLKSMQLLLFFLLAADPCVQCDKVNAKCVEEKCVCNEGFKGDGKTCEGKED